MAGLFSLIFFASLVLFLIGIFKPQTSLFWYGKERKKKKSALIYGLIAFASMILVGVFADKNPNSQTTGSTTSGNIPKWELSPAQKDSIAKAEKLKKIEEGRSVTVKASDLVALCVKNEINADNQLKAKKLYVEVAIGDIGKDILDNIYVTLESGDAIRTVQCYIEDKDLVARLQKGQRITFFGKCDGLMMNVLMKDCEVVPNLSDLEKQ